MKYRQVVQQEDRNPAIVDLARKLSKLGYCDSDVLMDDHCAAFDDAVQALINTVIKDTAQYILDGYAFGK